MNRSAKRIIKTGLMISAAIGLSAASNTFASDKLLKVLEENKVITAEQAAEVKAAEPKYTVRPSSKVIKDLQIRGRVQAQFGYVQAENDDDSGDYNTFELRRVRLGMRGTLFDKVRAQVEANMVPGSDFSMRSAFIQWRDMKPAYLKLGYDKPRSSIEENTSSAEILTVERTLINSLVAAPGPLTGLSIDGEIPMLIYGLGVYTDALNSNKAGSSDYMYNLMAGIKLDEFVGDKNKLLLQTAYMKSNDAAGAVGSKFDDCVTFGANAKIGRFDLRGEYFIGDADGDKTKGWYIMPAAYITEKLQAVVRFEQAESDKDGGIRAPSRYTRRVGFVNDEKGYQSGDDYQAVYMGLNHYFSGHPHKIMLGVELAELKNTDAGTLKATTVYTAWRMLF